MDFAMAPPVKRRKLSSTSSLEIHRDNCTEISDTSSRYTFPTSPRPNDAPTLQTSLPRVEEERSREVHPAVGGIEDFKVLLPRQGTVAVAADLSVSVSVAPTIAYQDASTTITYTPPATPSLPTLPSISGATTFSTTSTSISSTSTSAATTSNSTSNTTAESTSSSASRITSAPHSLTTSSIETNSTRSSSRTSNSVSADTFFIATLSDGDTTTITRARTAFVTTFGDGEVFTIPGLSSTLSRSGTSSATTTSDSEQSTISATALITGSNAASPGAYGTPATSAPSSSTSSGSASNNNHNSNSPPPAGTIAGGVVGGCAGLAVVVLIAMLFVRWYRRRSRLGHQALGQVSSDSPEQPGDLSRGPGMAERAGLMPLAAAVPAMFRHHNRSTEPSESSERGFTRISGRKLPSAWSEGMSSPPPEMPLNAAATNTAGASASYYRDSQGQYGGDGTGFPPSSPTASPTSPASSHGPLRSSTHEMMTMSPGPSRKPELHAGGPYGFTGGPSGFQRSDTPSSLDPSRNSRFTEEM